LRTLPAWGVAVVPPVDEGEGPRLAPTAQLLDAVRLRMTSHAASLDGGA
jgi:hypothetical protein